MIKLIIVFFIFLYGSNCSLEKEEFDTKWGCPMNYCHNFFKTMDKDDFEVVEVNFDGKDTVYVYAADKNLINRSLNNQLKDSVIGIATTE